jgi:hypothetical protein
MNNLTSTYKEVKRLLDKDAKFRDNDELLVVQIWHLELKRKGIDSRNISAFTFFDEYYKTGLLTTADMITRARRRVNELHASTRGKSYKPRKSKVPKVIEEIKTITPLTA